MKRLLPLLLAACAHTPNLELRPEPAPPGEEVASFDAHDGTKLWRRHWLPTAPVKGSSRVSGRTCAARSSTTTARPPS